MLFTCNVYFDFAQIYIFKTIFCDLDKVLPLEVLIFCLQFEGAEMVVKELTFRLLINIELKETLFVIIIIL